MEIHHPSASVPQHLIGGIVAVSDFNGFDLNHQAIVKRLVGWAHAEGRPAIVATFDPPAIHPDQRCSLSDRLTTPLQRASLLATAGVDAMIVFSFKEVFDERFVADRLSSYLQVNGIVVGDQPICSLRMTSEGPGFIAGHSSNKIVVEKIEPMMVDGVRVSTSSIYHCLRTGDLRGAAKMLSQPFTIEGIVQHGKKLGRTIGYPTANVDMGNYFRPAYGVYAVIACLANGQILHGVANLGIRPTFNPPKELLEPHFFDFKGDLYGQAIRIALIDYLRPEARFSSTELLIKQVEIDCIEARNILLASSSNHL